jgi:xylan 1,4-beta-xylosidase
MLTPRASLFLLLAATGIACLPMSGQVKPIQISVDAGKVIGDYQPVWNYFGADEPNYTYAPGGAKLMHELGAINPGVPVYFRPHNLLTTGDGTAALKWGSTNVYTEDASGNPVYNWAITDKLFDNLKSANVRPMVEIGFMPEALSPKPQPYQHNFPKAGNDVFTGWSYPPKDYAKWRALIVAYVTHLHDRYGAAADTWKWEVWNEPDIPYFHGTVEEYEKLYDVTTAAIRQVLPKAVVGGPGVTGGGENKHFLQLFLEHCARGVNADSGKIGAPLDFISYHPKGSPKFIQPAVPGEAGRVRMNLGRQLALTDTGMKMIASFPEWKHTPIILSETDPEGCAACKGLQNGYRNGPLYGVSVAEMLARSAELARLRGVNLQGAVTWAFEFENQPYFAGFRELATDGPEGLIDKPVLNVFRMFGKLSGSLIALTSNGAQEVTDIEKDSVAADPDINGIATRGSNSLDIILWNYHDEDVGAPDAKVAMVIANVPGKVVHVKRTVMDAHHSNAYAAWLALGSPEHLSPDQLAALQKASGLETVEMPTVRKTSGPVKMNLLLPRQAVVLYELSW